MSVRREVKSSLRYVVPVLALAIALGLILTASGAWAGAPPNQSSSSAGKVQQGKKALGPKKTGPAGKAVVNRPANPEVVLYDQYNNAGANATSSQNFEVDFDAFDDELADDFVVPAGQSWSVENVEVDGTYFNGAGPAVSVNIAFYTNGGTLPFTLVASRPNQAYVAGPTPGDFVITLTSPVVLPAGQYWMSVQVNMDYAVGGQWGWNDRTVQTNNAAAWRNPGDGFGSGCTDWGTKAGCGIPTADPDQVFRLNGTVGGPLPTFTPAPTFTPTFTHTPTSTPSPTLTPFCTPEGYGYTTSTGNSIVPGTTDVGNHCDDCTTNIALPFTFNFYNQPFTSANVSSNGNLQFSSVNAAYFNICLPDDTFNNAIFGHWDDLYTFDGASGQGIFTSVSGTAPNRIFNIEWRAQFCCSSGAPVVNFEIRLFEGPSGRFDLVYGNVQNNGFDATIGVQRDDGPLYTQFSCITSSLSTGLRIQWDYTTGNCPTNTPTPTPAPCGSTSDYTIEKSLGGAIVPGTTLVAGSQGDDVTAPVGIPFNFSLYGTNYTSALVSSNGNLQFSGDNANYFSECLPDDTFENTIFAHWDDLMTSTDMTNCSAYSSGCGVFTSVSGSAPNRIFNIEWRAVYYFDGPAINFELRLYEATGPGGESRFEVIYGNIPENGSDAVIGVQLGTGPRFTQYSCNVASISNTKRLVFRQYNCTEPTNTPAPTNTFVPTSTPTNTPTDTNTPTPTITPTPICPGAWTMRAAYPIPIMDEAVASHGGNLYSFAGVSNFAIIADSYKYTPSTNSWTPIAALPAAREQASAVSDGTYIYILGGADIDGFDTNSLYRYDPATNSYTTLAPYVNATWAQAAAYLNGKIYRIGGCQFNCGASTATVEEYNIASNTWTTKAPMPAAAGWLMATAIGNYIYVAGGTVPAETNKTYRFDPVANTWDDAAIADLPELRWGSSEAVAKGQWRLAGGYSNDEVIGTAISWNPTTNVWTAIDPLPVTRARMSGDSIGVDFYSVGGREPLGGFSGNTENQKYTDICQSSNVLVGHLTVQGITQPHVRNTLVTPTLELCVGGVPQVYNPTLDQSGTFTLPTTLGNGTYNYRIKWVRGLANSGSLVLAGGTNNHEFGTLRGGDANNSNIVNAQDFNILRNNFGTSGDRPSDFNLDQLTNASDFNILRNNFGVAGGSLACP